MATAECCSVAVPAASGGLLNTSIELNSTRRCIVLKKYQVAFAVIIICVIRLEFTMNFCQLSLAKTT